MKNQLHTYNSQLTGSSFRILSASLVKSSMNDCFAFAVNLSFAFDLQVLLFVVSQYVIDRFAMKVKSERVKSEK